MFLQYLLSFIFRRNRKSKSKPVVRCLQLHGSDFWKHQLDIVVEEKRYWTTMYHIAMKELAKREKEVYTPSTEASRHHGSTIQCYKYQIPTPEYQAHQPAPASNERPTISHKEASTAVSLIRTDFIPASTTLASIARPSSCPLTLSPPRRERVLCCDCSICESEREVSRETAEALLDLSAKTSRLQQEIAQLKLEHCIKDQLIAMLRRRSEEEDLQDETCNNLDSISFISIPHHRPRLSLPPSPRKTFYL